MASTQVKVRVQALGGKFLGDDIGGAIVTIRDSQTGQLFASGTTTGDSGNLGTSYSPTSSLFTIVTPQKPQPTIRWLSPDSDASKTSHFSPVIDLTRPTLLEISASGPVGGLQSAHQVTTREWFLPAIPPTELGLVIVIPGLLVQVMQPATHSAVTAANSPLTIEANVGMMCGCPINNTEGNPWQPDDFQVLAEFRRVNPPRPEPVLPPVILGFAGIASRFRGLAVIPNVAETAYYELIVVARQFSTGNIGTGIVTLIVNPS